MPTPDLHRSPRHRRPVRRVGLAALALVALLGTACGGGDGSTSGATATTAADADTTVTSTAGTTATANTPGAAEPPCTAVSAKDVEGIVGEPVVEAPELAAKVMSPDAHASSDDLCIFSPVAAQGTLAALVQRSDDSRTWEYINMILEANAGGQAVTPVDGLGDQALANAYGAVGFLEGQTGTLVYVRLGSVDETVERALALARLVAG